MLVDEYALPDFAIFGFAGILADWGGGGSGRDQFRFFFGAFFFPGHAKKYFRAFGPNQGTSKNYPKRSFFGLNSDTYRPNYLIITISFSNFWVKINFTIFQNLWKNLRFLYIYFPS